ncbi:MAG: peptide transporter permease [Alphaproteobacteria bacterium]|nr:peptide transporter permease [Alphaproteobacteria bacterium]
MIHHRRDGVGGGYEARPRIGAGRMTNRILLNNIDHHALRFSARHGAEHGDSVNQMIVFPTEFEALQREYPILLRRGADGDYQALALLGLDRDENLFLAEDGRWDARYVPALAARGPFSIGIADQAAEPMIHVDLDDSRIGEQAGDPLFLPQGGNAPGLQRIADLLGTIYDGIELARPLFAALDAAGLIEPVKLEIRLSETELYALEDFCSIAPEAIAALDGETLAALNRSGHLRAAFLLLASLGTIDALIARKAARRALG